MKTLLLTDAPPCRQWTAGLVLDQLCRFLPPGSAACYVVAGPACDARISPDLAERIPTEYEFGPRQHTPALRWKQAEAVASLGIDLWTSSRAIPRIAKRVADFARRVGADRLWCVLEGQTLIRLANEVSDRLSLPLFTQVYDPPHWWLREHRVDGISQRKILRAFEEAVRRSRRCAAASWAMAEDYRAEYGVHATPVVPSLHAEIACPPAAGLSNSDRFVIGMAGKVYATAEWNCLIAALNSVSWRIRGRQIALRLLGRFAQFATDGQMCVEFLGWRSQAETVRCLSDADVLYCPYWFDPAFALEARQSFPSKLTSYLAAGRPTLFHGPEYASPAEFLRRYDAGYFCHSLDPARVVDALECVLSDEDLYCRIAANGSRAFHERLTLQAYRRSFAEFLALDEDSLTSLSSPPAKAA